MKEKVPYIPVQAWVVNEKEHEKFLQDAKKTKEEVKAGYMRLIDGIKMREVAGQTLMVPTGKAVSKVYQPAMLNSDAAELVKMMTEDFTVDTIVENGLKIFRVSEEVLRKDVENLVDQLALAGMLEGEEVDRRLKKATTTLSGTAVMEQKKVISSKIESIKRTFRTDESDNNK